MISIEPPKDLEENQEWTTIEKKFTELADVDKTNDGIPWVFMGEGFEKSLKKYLDSLSDKDIKRLINKIEAILCEWDNLWEESKKRLNKLKAFLISLKRNQNVVKYEINGKIWEVYKKVSGQIKEVYPITTISWESTGEYGIIFETHSKNPEDRISKSYSGRNYSKFKKWQRVYQILFKCKRLATVEEKEEGDADKNWFINDLVYVIVPYWGDERNYLKKVLKYRNSQKIITA